jgi:hypothetical protein
VDTQRVAAGGADDVDELRVACLLTGCRTPGELSLRPLVVGPALARWIPREGALHTRVAGQG